MQPAAIGTTCRDALLIFSQQQTLQLQAEVDRLTLENYHLKLPRLSYCASEFNARRTSCYCIFCIAAARSDREDYEYDDWRAAHATNHAACQFRGPWEAYLQSVGATLPSEDEHPTILSGKHFDTPACVYTTDRNRWGGLWWGQPLSSLQSPRKAVWDRIVLECTADEDDDDDVPDEPVA